MSSVRPSQGRDLTDGVPLEEAHPGMASPIRGPGQIETATATGRTGGKATTMRWTGALLTALLIVAACGDDGADTSANDARTGSGSVEADTEPDSADDSSHPDAAADDADRLTCSLLDLSDVEAVFGDQGRVRESECDLWVVGESDPEADPLDITSPPGGVVYFGIPEPVGREEEGMSPAEAEFAFLRENFYDAGLVYDQAIEITDLGDEAYYRPGASTTVQRSILYFRSGEELFLLSADFNFLLEDTQDRVLSLARTALERL